LEAAQFLLQRDDFSLNDSHGFNRAAKRNLQYSRHSRAMRWKSEGDFKKVFAGYSLFTGRPSVRTLGKRSGSFERAFAN
jgi:hypothetical protein